MKTAFHWRWVAVLLTTLALVHPTAFAQPRTANPDPAADAGEAPAPPPAADPGLSSGADAGTPEARPASAPDSVFGAGAPTQQVVAPRPDPTPGQVAGFRTLEDEVNGFLSRGGGFRDSINGLLRRHHERQLARMRAGFDRQIQAERAAEGEARRHAIEVFLRFLETYPEDAERTPDVMFRLAELYFDESAYAKLDADERADRQRAERQAQGLPSDDIGSAPVDYRCSVLLYRHIVSRFSRFRMADSTHYLLGWVLKEMGREDEAMSAYRGLVCPGSYHYESERGFDLAAALQPVDQPVICPRLFDILRPRAPQLVSPPAAETPDGGVAEAVTVPSLVEPPANEPLPIPRTYAACQPLNGPTGQPSRYAGEVWYFVGDYHFDNARDDAGNAMSIAAYQQSMRASERARPVTAAGRTPTTGIQGAGQNATEQPDAARAQFNPAVDYQQFWSKALYKVGWAYFRMQNGYPAALRSFAYLLDYYDYVGAEASAQGNRADTIKWIGVIFTESDWGLAQSDEGTRCQQVVETVARPPADAPRPFDCAGIMRIVSPADAMSVATAREGTARATPQPGRPTYIPQDRPWTPEAYLDLANNYFQQTKYYEAITLYRIFLQLYPLHFQAPRVAESIAMAYERQRQFEQAITARGRLANYTEGTAWWNNNNNHPEAQRYADLVARNSLHDTAIQHHQAAGRYRQEALRLTAQARSLQGPAQATALQQASERVRLANEEYQAAVQAYGQFVQSYPNDEAAYEFRYNRGDALFWARRYEEASRAYAEVRESNENDQYLVASAYMAVKSQEAHIRSLAVSRQLDPCLAVRAGIPADDLVDDQGNSLLTGNQATSCLEMPPAPGVPTGQANSVLELNIPQPVRDLMDARIAYANRVPQNLDNAEALREVVTPDPAHPENNPPYRPKFAYINARTLMRYGHVREAELLLRAILRVYCTDQTVAGASFADLNNIMVVQGRQDDQESLAAEQAQRTCAGVDQRTVGDIRADSVFRHAMDLFRQAERAPAGEAVALYERAARDMEAAVAANRTHPQAALATYYVALAYERTNRFDTATQTYVRITQDFNNTRNAAGQELTGDDLAQRINILEQSNFRAGVNLERIFDYDRALQFYNTVATDPRFATATGHDEHVHDALASIALINTNLGRWPAARLAWQAFLPRANAGRERAEAEYNLAQIPFRAGNWTEAITSLQNYLRTSAATGDTAQFRVQAQYNIALAYRNLNNAAQYRRALREVVTVYRASGQQPGSVAAAWAAEALFRDLDDQVTEFRRNTFTQGDATALRAQLDRFKTQLRAIDEAARQVVQLRGGEYSIGALVRQGQAHEHLATQERRIGENLQLSRDQQARITQAQRAIAQLRSAAEQLRRAGRDAQADALEQRASETEQQLEDQRTAATQQVQATFDQEADAETQLAIINYGTAIHTARSNNIPTPFATEALRALRSEDNARLVEPALTQQRVFEYRPGMFDGEAAGAVLPQASPVASSGLATE